MDSPTLTDPPGYDRFIFGAACRIFSLRHQYDLSKLLEDASGETAEMHRMFSQLGDPTLAANKLISTPHNALSMSCNPVCPSSLHKTTSPSLTSSISLALTASPYPESLNIISNIHVTHISSTDSFCSLPTVYETSLVSELRSTTAPSCPNPSPTSRSFRYVVRLLAISFPPICYLVFRYFSLPYYDTCGY